VDDQGEIADESARTFLRQFMDTFVAWVERHAG
jgi:hypothetical protein